MCSSQTIALGFFYDSTINFFFFFPFLGYSVLCLPGTFQAVNCTYFSFESVKTAVSDTFCCRTRNSTYWQDQKWIQETWKIAFGYSKELLFHSSQHLTIGHKYLKIFSFAFCCKRKTVLQRTNLIFDICHKICQLL